HLVKSATIDHMRGDAHQRDGDRLLADLEGKTLSLLRRAQLRIAQSGDHSVRWKDHRGSHERARERAAPHLICPGDKGEAFRPETFLDRDAHALEDTPAGGGYRRATARTLDP